MLGDKQRNWFALVIIIILFTFRSPLLRRSSLVGIPEANNHILHQQSSSSVVMSNLEEYVKEDYRAFLFAVHPDHGMLLLHCTRKKKKPPHFQCPGGHVDKEDFEYVVLNTPESNHRGPPLLIHASKIGAARELFEETGIDVRSALNR